MQVAIDLSEKEKAFRQAADIHLQKQDAIKRCIELHARTQDIWMTYSDIAEFTGLHIKDVVKIIYNSRNCFLVSSWRIRHGQQLVTTFQLYRVRTPFFEKLLAVMTGQRD